MPDTDVTAIRDELSDFKRETNYRLNSLEKQSAVEAVHRANVEKRLTGIEENTKWLIRLVVGAVLAGIIGWVLQGGLTIGT